MVNNRYGVHLDKEGGVIWDKWRRMGTEEATRQTAFIVEGRKLGYRGHALWTYCERRESETGPHHEPTWVEYDRSQLCPFGREDPRWWPHTQEERDEQRAKLAPIFEALEKHTGKKGRPKAEAARLRKLEIDLRDTTPKYVAPKEPDA